MIWWILTAIAIIGFVALWNRPNSIGGGMMLGFMVGIVAALVRMAMGYGFQWSIVGKCVVSAMIFGIILELMPKKRT